MAKLSNSLPEALNEVSSTLQEASDGLTSIALNQNFDEATRAKAHARTQAVDSLVAAIAYDSGKARAAEAQQ